MDVPILLVDGVGRPKIHVVQVTLLQPSVVRWPHPQRAAKEAQVIVNFDRSKGEIDSEGRQIYRMRGSGVPPVRPGYLGVKVPMLRIEEPEKPKPHHQGNQE